jgi:hypothetical protein
MLLLWMLQFMSWLRWLRDAEIRDKIIAQVKVLPQIRYLYLKLLFDYFFCIIESNTYISLNVSLDLRHVEEVIG